MAMTTMVCFHSAGAAYCMPVEATHAVRDISGMIALPAGRPEVAGIITGNHPMTVISPLGVGGGSVLVVEASRKSFGLLVDAVTRLRWIDDADIRRAPPDQDRPLISGTVDTDCRLTLITNPSTLGSQL